jgi:hypothetical protein
MKTAALAIAIIVGVYVFVFGFVWWARGNEQVDARLRAAGFVGTRSRRSTAIELAVYLSVLLVGLILSLAGMASHHSNVARAGTNTIVAALVYRWSSMVIRHWRRRSQAARLARDPNSIR